MTQTHTIPASLPPAPDYLGLEPGTRLGDAVYIGNLEDGSEAWHAQRGKVIGGSDVASVCGVPGAFKSAYLLWLEKSGFKEADTPSDDMQELFDWGHALEPAIIQMFEKHNPDIRVATTGSWVNVDRPFQGINTDGITIDPNGNPFGIFEAKYSMRGHGWENDTCPAKYVAQLRYYLSGFGFDHGYLCCFLTGKLLMFYVPRNATQPVINMRTGGEEWFSLGEDTMLPMVESFLNSLPAEGFQGNPPPLRGDDDEIAWLASRNPEIDGKDIVIPFDLAERWAKVRIDKKAIEEAEKIVKGELMQIMGKAKAAKAGYDIGKKKAKTVAMRKNGKGGSITLSGVGVATLPVPYELKPEDVPAVEQAEPEPELEANAEPQDFSNVVDLPTAASTRATLDEHNAKLEAAIAAHKATTA